jgi:hypothetical protein
MPRQVYSWDEVTDEEMKAFYESVYALRASMLSRDCDGHYPVEIIIVDRRQYTPMQWQPVPYEHKDPEGYFEATLRNMASATARMSLALELDKLNNKPPEPDPIGAHTHYCTVCHGHYLCNVTVGCIAPYYSECAHHSV